MTVLVTEIAERLRAARKAAGYRSATAFTQANGIPLSTYSQHESGTRALGADMLLHYSALLGVKAGWLLSGEESSHAAESVSVDTQELSPIQGDIATVDMTLFSEVLLRLLPVVSQYELGMTNNEVLEFAFEVYNGVITTSASKQDKLSMIDLSIASLKRGAVQRGLERKTA